MKLFYSIFISFITTTTVFCQCDCQTITKDDNSKVVQCNPKPIAEDNTTQIGIAIASNGHANYVQIIVRFERESKDITGDFIARLMDNNMITLKLINTQQAFIGNSEVSNAIFELPKEQEKKFRYSNIKTVTIKLSDGKLRTYEVKVNANTLRSQLLCL
jgi:hypothetical protein